MDEIERGPEVFAQLSEDEQLQVLGPGKFETYRSGRITLQDLVGERQDPHWGPVGYERSLMEAWKVAEGTRVGHDVRSTMFNQPDIPGLPRSLSAAASLQAARRQQLLQMTPAEIDTVIGGIRQERSIPKLSYHFRLHGADLNAKDEQEYVQMLLAHLQRADLRIFSFLRTRGQVPMWALVAPGTADTFLYNQVSKRIWSFYRPGAADIRMQSVQTLWIELIRTVQGWRIEDSWQW